MSTRKIVKKLSDSQMDYIDQHWRDKTKVQIAEEIGSSENTVSWYCTVNNYRKAPAHKSDSRLLAPGEKTQPSDVFVKVKCLSEYQMKYILINHEEKNVRQMAFDLQVEEYKVSLFCQANAIVPKSRWKYKRKDDYHIQKKSKKMLIPPPPKEFPELVRAPTVYSNRSQAEIITYYQNLKIA